MIRKTTSVNFLCGKLCYKAGRIEKHLLTDDKMNYVENFRIKYDLAMTGEGGCEVKRLPHGSPADHIIDIQKDVIKTS